jgi:hypothetical protein
MGNAFAYKIDYDASIAEDEKQIAALTNPVLVAAARFVDAAIARFPDSTSAQWSVLDLVIFDAEGQAERAAVFGLTLDDVRAWRVWMEGSGHNFGDFGATLGPEQPGDVRRGIAVADRWDGFYLCTEAERVAALKVHKTRLARHRRNKAKFGG